MSISEESFFSFPVCFAVLVLRKEEKQAASFGSKQPGRRDVPFTPLGVWIRTSLTLKERSDAGRGPASLDNRSATPPTSATVATHQVQCVLNDEIMAR
mmetsp:Transcript_3917/g.9681  ORF Transcript_3917/g.9681 Transcript_3917/m.9681 type:complete len:98 (+) Transcript_3917:662-955(+)